MKKLGLFLSAISLLFLVSCCNNGEKKCAQTCDKAKKECCSKECSCKKDCGDKKTCNMTEGQKAECKAFCEKWANFETLTVEEQKELIARKKAYIEGKREAMKAEIAECEAKWANFDGLTVEEQKVFLDSLPCQKKCSKDKSCKKACEKKCEKEKKSCSNNEVK